MSNIRQEWVRSTPLCVNDRVIVGFDIRKQNSLDRIFMTSYDESVRYEDFNEEHFNDTSAINLFNVDPSEMKSLSTPDNARVISFDLPTPFAEFLIEIGISSPHEMLVPITSLTGKWIFCGFDIVDAFTQTSGFHGFNLADGELEYIIKSVDTCFNRYGLIDDFKMALNICGIFDDIISEHYPFMPCGIWLKPTNEREMV